MFAFGTPGVLTLDRPVSNFDVAGIPRTTWSSGLFSCFENIFPSCVCSFCCAPVVFGQVSVRAQIPLFIDTKNSILGPDVSSGYCYFLNSFLWCGLLTIGMVFVTLITHDTLRMLFGLLSIGSGVFVCFLLSHLRSAVKEKYSIAGPFPTETHSACNCIYDLIVAVGCCPCSLAQIARHIFQYDVWEPKLGALYCGDPSLLPPLTTDFVRPPEADSAGLSHVDNYNNKPHHRPGNTTLGVV